MSKDKPLKRITITVSDEVYSELKAHKIKNVSEFMQDAALEKLKNICQKKMTQTLTNFPRKKPIEPSVSGVRKRREIKI